MLYGVPDRSELRKSLWIKTQMTPTMRRNSVNTGSDDCLRSFLINEDRRTTANAREYAQLPRGEICVKNHAVTEERLKVWIRVLAVTKNKGFLCDSRLKVLTLNPWTVFETGAECTFIRSAYDSPRGIP